MSGLEAMDKQDKTSPEADILRQAGIPDHAVEALLKVDAILHQWRREVSKRELGTAALRELGLNLELSQLDVLMAIASNSGDLSRNETLVGTIAERLWIDPSRASRLVSEVVEKGYVSRAASQTDSRRTVLELTEAGQIVADTVRMYKYLKLGSFFANWSMAELNTFVPQLAKFSTWVSQSQTLEDPAIQREINAIAAKLNKTEKSLQESNS